MTASVDGELQAKYDEAVRSIKELSELYKKLAEQKRGRRDAHAIYSRRARSNIIIVATAGIAASVVILALMVESGYYGLPGIVACIACPATSAFVIWSLISPPNDFLIKEYFFSMDQKIWETEGKIRDIERKYNRRALK